VFDPTDEPAVSAMIGSITQVRPPSLPPFTQIRPPSLPPFLPPFLPAFYNFEKSFFLVFDPTDEPAVSAMIGSITQVRPPSLPPSLPLVVVVSIVSSSSTSG